MKPSCFANHPFLLINGHRRDHPPRLRRHGPLTQAETCRGTAREGSLSRLPLDSHVWAGIPISPSNETQAPKRETSGTLPTGPEGASMFGKVSYLASGVATFEASGVIIIHLYIYTYHIYIYGHGSKSRTPNEHPNPH